MSMEEKTGRTERTEKKEKTLREKIGRRIYAERLMSQMTQSDLAEKLHTEKSNISRIENGRQNISVDYLASIAKAMNKEAELALSDIKVSYMDTTVYSLRLYDDELMQFKMTRSLKGDHGFDVEILNVNEDMKHLFPLDLEVFPEGVLKWLKNRAIPSNREMVGEILKAIGLEGGDLKGIIDICFGLSLNDSYWVTPYDFEGSFSEYNLYENRFDEALSYIAYIGYGEIDKKFMTTPELTTGGMLRKAWRYKGDDEIWLYKSGTDGFANTGNEPFSEFYASQVAERMGINAVHYGLERWCHIISSTCKLFTDINTSFIPIGRIVKAGGIDACIDFYKALGDDFYQQLASMLCFDAVVLNEDRHFGNFGVLRDNHTGEIIAPAPVFDNGVSLLCYALESDFTKGINTYINSRTNPYGSQRQFIELARSVMGPVQKDQLKKLIGFRFTESSLENLPTWRLKALEKIIQERVRDLLAE